MRFAVISDIHGNLEALRAVSESIRREGVDRIVFAGDAVGYGADPLEVIEVVKSVANAAVLGNHDSVASGREEPTYFNVHAAEAILWTRGRLGDDERAFLKGLDVSVTWEDFTVVHSTPLNPLRWSYLLAAEEAAKNFPAFKSRLCFIGHSHVPAAYCMGSKGELSVEAPGLVPLKEGWRYIINVGSVGQPRDGDPRSCYVVYDADRQFVEFLRVAYDVSSAQEKIIGAGLPPFLAQRLAHGI